MRFLANSVLFLLLATICNAVLAQSTRPPISITPVVTGVDASFRGLAVRNSQEAWVTGTAGTVIRTVDAGQTWQRVVVPDASELDFRDVELLGDKTVLLMSIGNGDSSKIFRSDDNGETWSTVLVNAEPKGFFDGMSFDKNGRDGWLYGDPIDGQLDLYKTSDAGLSWKRLPTKRSPKLAEGEYGFAASGTGIAVLGNHVWIATGGSVARVWLSDDEGETWQANETKIRSGNESSGIFSIDIIDQDNAIAIGGNYTEPDLDQSNVATSSDGGKTWINVANASMPHKACVQSLGKGRLLTCGRTGIAYSDDLGKTWTTISTDSYYTLRFDKGSGTGFLAGKDGHVARFELADLNE
ncbi:hypothetical protein LOC67_15330 [Stieleria sp. JC731]|uniref:WD40/YVTN/BNR-like repeat-containing protein n=1 Tax=Pirellulaceae TaxID=2691357 RepID=UPI001E3515AB|nr:hypothetical protein [Stieleria sp. JC731]MCC9601932.1 hypothetical protein [Stieleria sp. JC731]